MIFAAIFIGILGTNVGIGIYITYILVPVFSCLYFDPKFTKKISAFSYIIMIISLYIESWNLYDVVYLHRSRIRMFAAYALGFTFEYIVVVIVLYFIVKRAKMMMEERYSAEEESKMKSRIKQVMFNYASNAIKYTESGRIDITVSCVKKGNKKINLNYQVKDTGCGIKMEDFDKLFVKYSQLEVEKNHSKEGTGIGLAICK